MKEEKLEKAFEDAKENIRKELEENNICYLFATNNKLIAVGENNKLLALLSQIVDSFKKEISDDEIMNAVELGLAEDKEKFVKNSLIELMQNVIDKMKEE